jgi:hypothetical protein
VRLPGSEIGPESDSRSSGAKARSIRIEGTRLLFGKKQRSTEPLTISTRVLDGVSGNVPCGIITGEVPPGSEGNAIVSTGFGQMLQAVDVQLSPRRLLIYDMTHLRYEFGDHIGAFFWNMPALLDGVAIMVAATGNTRRNLESLQQFVGSWLPVGFCDSLDAISAQICGNTEFLRVLSEKRDLCSQQGRSFPAGETGVHIVLLGSRQTGRQYRTFKECRVNEADLDCGVVGGPGELALLTMKMSNQPGLVPNVQHPPIKTYSSVAEAQAQGLLVVMPKTRSSSKM